MTSWHCDYYVWTLSYRAINHKSYVRVKFFVLPDILSHSIIRLMNLKHLWHWLKVPLESKFYDTVLTMSPTSLCQQHLYVTYAKIFSSFIFFFLSHFYRFFIQNFFAFFSRLKNQTVREFPDFPVLFSWFDFFGKSAHLILYRY